MIKPLLKVLPSLSGNVKLACNIIDPRPTDNPNVWEASVRGARILPITSQLWQSGLEANLISSSWEYDLPKFYQMYSNIFYDSVFHYDKTSIMSLDKHSTQKVRANDFEYGVKRISYQKNGKQFAFFAPIYIDDSNDLPAYFEIAAKIHNVNPNKKEIYSIRRYLRINIANEINYKKAYLGRYLSRYLSKIDNNVAFCTPMTNQATFYGIDLRHCGFVTAVDNMMDRIYHYQNTIQNFDATIAGAFKRNTIAIKQILPLAFYFNVQDFLTDPEKNRFRNSIVEFSGAYYDSDGNKLQTYDFSTDYTEFKQDILTMDEVTGSMTWTNGLCNNLMDVSFPSLNEGKYINYEFANKLAPWFCRWKMKYSNDEHPYITNNSWAFSKNQDSNYRYGTFPSIFNEPIMLAKSFQTSSTLSYEYDLQLPLGKIGDKNSGIYFYTYAPDYEHPEIDESTEELVPGPYKYIVDTYKRIKNGYCTNWFNVTSKADGYEYNPDIFNNDDIWMTPVDDCVYYNGILYDLRNIYDMFENPQRIDKFAVIVEPDIKILTRKEINELSFAEQVLYRNGVSQISSPNVIANPQILTYSQIETEGNIFWPNTEYEYGGELLTDELQFNKIFQKATYDTGYFIDALNAAYYYSTYVNGDNVVSYRRSHLNYYNLNQYYTIQDSDYILEKVNQIVKEEYNNINSETLKDIISKYVMPHYGYIDNLSIDTTYAVTSYTSLDVSQISLLTYKAIDPNIWSYTYTDEEYRWALTHNDGIINIPDGIGDIPVWLQPHSTYLIETDNFANSMGFWVTETENDNYSYVTTYDDNNREDYTYLGFEDLVGYAYLTYEGYNQPDKEEPWFILDSSTDSDETTLFNIFLNNTYVCHSNDGSHMIVPAKSTTHYSYDGQEYTYTYLAVGNKEDSNADLGTQIYWLSYMIPSSQIPYYGHDFDAYTCLAEYVQSQSGPEWNVDDLTNRELLYDWANQGQDHKAAFLAGSIATWKHNVYERILKTLQDDRSLTKWQFVPLRVYNENILAKNVFLEYSNWTSRFYGDMIPLSQLSVDKDVLWADPYNLTALYKREGYEEIPDDTVFDDMYVQFLNKQHLFYWYVELYKDADRKTVTDFATDEWYKYLYIAVDKWIFDFEGNGIRKQGIPYRRRIYIPLETILSNPEFYSQTDLDRPWDKPYRSFNTFYNSINYSVVDNVFTFHGTMVSAYSYNVKRFTEDITYLGVDENKTVKKYTNLRFIPFKLCYKKRMARVDERLWDITHIGDEYTEVKVLTQETTYVIPSPCYLPSYFNVENDVKYNIYTKDQDTHEYIGTTYLMQFNGPGSYEGELKDVYKYSIYGTGKIPMKCTNGVAKINTSKYRDIYMYHLQNTIEHDRQYEGVLDIPLVADQNQLSTSLNIIETYNYITYNAGGEPYETVGYYNKPKVLSTDPNAYIDMSDSTLVPLFDNIFLQPSSESMIYAHYLLNDITEAAVIEDQPDDAGQFKKIHTNYRLNAFDKKLLMEISANERDNLYHFTNLYEPYHGCYSELSSVSNDLPYNDTSLSTYVGSDGTVYGFYYIKSHMTNTTDTVDMYGVTLNNQITHLRSVNYINGHDLRIYPQYISSIFNSVVPFIKEKLLLTLSNINTIVYPKTYNFDLIYSQIPATGDTNKSEINIIRNNKKLRTTSLMRYFHNITPWIVPVTDIKNEWRLKMKDVKEQLLDTGKYLSIGDATIYSTPVNINKFVPYNIYSDNYATPSYKYTPLEYKFYNNSKMVILEPHIVIPIRGYLTYAELLEKESSENVLLEFSKYIEKTKKTFDDDELIFLLNKYNVSFDSVPVKLNAFKTEKMYTLKIVFDLL